MSGDLAVPGLTAPVRVVRDTWGVPHIYASNQSDLFFAQGFVQAEDRLFQMDLWRRAAQGRLAEVLGPNFIERDAMTRRIQYRGDVTAEWESYGPDAKQIAEAFVRGINAWVALARERPPEQFVLAGWTPDVWAAEDLLNRTDAFVESGDAADEIFRARFIAAVGLARARVLLGASQHAYQAPSGIDLTVIPPLVADMIRRVGTPPFFLGLAAPAIDGTVRRPTVAPSASGSAPGATERGEADRDPERHLASPSRWYFVHLNAPGWNVIGATPPWLPGVSQGHNDRIGFTADAAAADTQDVYVEKLNPSNSRQVEDNGRWVDIETRSDRIAVRGRKTPVDFTLETTRHGVIVASDLERQLAFAIRWSGGEPGAAAGMAATSLDRAASWDDAKAALGRWKMPARRITIVDARGRRDAVDVELVPRRRGWDGALPAPGWTGAAEWEGWMTSPSTVSKGAGAPAADPKPPLSTLIVDFARLHPDQADALLQQLGALASSRDAVTGQRAVIVATLADALRDRDPHAGVVQFSHPLAVTASAKRRFLVTAAAPAGRRAMPLAFTFDPGDWDRSSAIDAPGQSESPDSVHFADLAQLWSEGKTFPLVFSDRAVTANTAVTLTLR